MSSSLKRTSIPWILPIQHNLGIILAQTIGRSSLIRLLVVITISHVSLSKLGNLLLNHLRVFKLCFNLSHRIYLFRVLPVINRRVLVQSLHLCIRVVSIRKSSLSWHVYYLNFLLFLFGLKLRLSRQIRVWYGVKWFI